MPAKISLVRGMKDISPDEIYKWHKLENAARKTFAAYGYRELRFPALERIELFVRGIGTATDIVEKEMYSFRESDDEVLALRPEGTASAVRSFIESGGAISNPEWRVYYIGPMFRRERPQKGRYRQFHQIGVEAFGSPSPFVDAEQIKMLFALLEELGVGGINIEVNSLGCSVCRPPYRQKLVDYFIPRRETLCENCKRRLGENPLRVLDCKEAACKQAAKDAPLMINNLCGECEEHFGDFKKYMGFMGLKEGEHYKVNPLIVRGLDYYNRTAFELSALDNRLGSQNAVAGGGRYDGLVETLGGKSTPAVGWALGCERLISLFPEEKPEPTAKVFIACIPETRQNAAALAKELRSLGISTIMEHEDRSFKAQFKKAGKLGAKYALVMGEEEIKKGVVTLKNLEISEQIEYNLQDVVEIIRKKELS